MAAFDEVCDEMRAGWQPADRTGRKDFALAVARHADRWAMFALLDGRLIRPELLKRAKPEPGLTPSGRVFTEDNA